jgi:hypothetical protein
VNCGTPLSIGRFLDNWGVSQCNEVDYASGMWAVQCFLRLQIRVFLSEDLEWRCRF